MAASNSAWPSKELDRPLFPLSTVGQVRNLFEAHLKRPQPNLALLSLVAGYVENSLTQAKETMTFPGDARAEEDDAKETEDVTNVNLPIDPAVTWDAMETLMTKFEATVRGFCDPDLLASVKSGGEWKSDVIYNCRQLIKHIADIIWNTLTKSQYKDRPHLQSIYSYLTGQFKLSVPRKA